MSATQPGRLLGLDLGEVRIGIAVSDALGITAQPLPTVQRTGERADLRHVADLARDNAVHTVVVGLPLLLSGASGSGADAARAFAEKLGRRLDGVPVKLWDERMTSLEAERVLIAGGVRRRQRRDAVDAMAAVLILQSYLDACGSAS